ncbi:hypothetical protein CLPU_14c00620 [Gottschalkia purinilytica]|uniref:Uncharacterized protein n=1 Tax=Gottschalkia purinilytica TaxID=1503 RepID=A0A0L0W7X4_GOTPU|nr:hypothetical protein [Gottschalkia purinilytica]KNF07644.1 hypothetical protein CLPU_14c00620 [Gottschalkia purinilytica]
MSETLLINDKKYIYRCNYKDDSTLRNSFNRLTEKTYGFNFKQWYENGYWGDKYIPYSLLDGDNVVSNVSVNIIDFLILGEQKRDVFAIKEVKLDKIINAMMNEKTKKVVLGFTPNNISSYEKSLVNEEDTTLFIKIGKDNPFKIRDLMFPVLSHA